MAIILSFQPNYFLPSEVSAARPQVKAEPDSLFASYLRTPMHPAKLHTLQFLQPYYHAAARYGNSMDFLLRLSILWGQMYGTLTMVEQQVRTFFSAVDFALNCPGRSISPSTWPIPFARSLRHHSARYRGSSPGEMALERPHRRNLAGAGCLAERSRYSPCSARLGCDGRRQVSTVFSYLLIFTHCWTQGSRHLGN